MGRPCIDDRSKPGELSPACPDGAPRQWRCGPNVLTHRGGCVWSAEDDPNIIIHRGGCVWSAENDPELQYPTRLPEWDIVLAFVGDRWALTVFGVAVWSLPASEWQIFGPNEMRLTVADTTGLVVNTPTMTLVAA